MSVPRITKEDRDHLRHSFAACETWRSEHGVWIGDHDGWRIWLCQEADGACFGVATHDEKNIKVELPRPLAKQWFEQVLLKAAT